MGGVALGRIRQTGLSSERRSGRALVLQVGSVVVVFSMCHRTAWLLGRRIYLLLR